MSRATLTLRGMMRGNPNLFKDLVVPAGIDKNILIDRIMLDCNNFQVVFPDGVYFQYMLGQWSKSRLDVWERLEATRHYDYNPIHNYDRHEEETSTRDGRYHDTGNREHDHTTDTTGNEVYAGNMNYDDTGQNSTVTTVAGYNSADDNTPDNTVSGTDSKNHTQDESSTADRTGKEVNTSVDNMTEDRKEDWTDDRELYAYGNIGVTSSQELVNQQREVELFNLYEIISDEFATQFCILVY